MFLFNLVTFTGGLLLKRYWTAALWFSSGFLVIAFFNWFISKAARQQLAVDPDALEVYPWVFNAHVAYLGLVVSGVVLSFIYYRKRRELPKSSPFLIALAIVSTTLSVASTYSNVSSAGRYVSTVLRQGGMPYLHPDHALIYESIKFRKDIYMEKANTWGKPSLLAPSGEHEINGIITWNGEPAVTTVKLYLNNYWRTETIWTDKEGRFTFSVGLEAPEVNRIDLDRWRNKPDDNQEYMPVLVKPIHDFKGSFFDDANYKDSVQVSDDSSSSNPDIIISLNPFIEMVWPKHVLDNAAGSASEDSISWLPVKNAHKYEIMFSRYTSEKSARQYKSISVNTNSIKLSDLSLVDAEEPEKYYINVSAFDLKGRFLGATKSGFSKMAFSIDGKNIPKDDNLGNDCK